MAYVQTDNHYLYIRLQEHGEILAKHRLAKGKGEVISDPAHRERNQTKRDGLIQQIQDQLADAETSTWFIERLTERYPRHLIDQLKVVQSVIGNYPDFVDDALDEVKQLKLTSANDLRDIAISLEIESQKKQKKACTINEKYKDFVAPERTADIYLSVLQGGEQQ